MLRTIVFLTLGQLATGILLFIGFVPPSSIGKGFGRFHALLALGLWMLAVWGNFSTPFYLLAALLLITAFASTKNSLFYPFLGLSFLCSLWILAQKASPGAGLVNAASD